jgi:hypothetical protein
MTDKKSIIYLISSPDNLKVYIGSTIKKYLCNRKADHHHKYKTWKDGKHKNKCTAFDLFDEFGFENCKFEEIEKCNIENRYIRERFWYEFYNDKKVNKCRPAMTEEEEKECKHKSFLKFKNEQNEKYKERNRLSYLKHKEKTSEVILCECGKTYTRNHKNRHFLSKSHIDNMQS